MPNTTSQNRLQYGGTVEHYHNKRIIYNDNLEFEDTTSSISLQELERMSRVSVDIKVTKKIESEFVATEKRNKMSLFVTGAVG